MCQVLAWVSVRLTKLNDRMDTRRRRANVLHVNYIRLAGFPVTYAGSMLYAYLMNISPWVRSSPFVPFRRLRLLSQSPKLTRANVICHGFRQWRRAKIIGRERTPTRVTDTWKLRRPVEVCCMSKLGAGKFQLYTVKHTCYGYTAKLTGLTTSWEDNAAFETSCSQDPRAVYISEHFGSAGITQDDSDREARDGNFQSCQSNDRYYRGLSCNSEWIGPSKSKRKNFSQIRKTVMWLNCVVPQTQVLKNNHMKFR